MIGRWFEICGTFQPYGTLPAACMEGVGKLRQIAGNFASILTFLQRKGREKREKRPILLEQTAEMAEMNQN